MANMKNPGQTYFASRTGQETAAVVLSKGNSWFQNLDINGYLDKLKNAWMAYYGAYYTDVGSGHRITFTGEQEELVNLPVNHYRNICRHMHTMVTSNRPAMEARATNTDYESLVQTKLANGLLDYYLREKRLEDYLSRATEYAIVFGAGFIKMEWNATSGKIYDHIEPEYEQEEHTDPVTGEVSTQNKLDEDGNAIEKIAGYPVYEGDVMFSNLSPFDVVFDSTKEDSSQHDWVLVRSFKNKFDLIAKYPENADGILKQRTKSDMERYNFNGTYLDTTEDIAVYEFFHRKTESMPNGRYLLFVAEDVILMDNAMPYRRLPIYRISPADLLGTPYGYTDTFDLLPLQDALNSLYSAVLTNQNAFAVQNVLSPRGTDINPMILSGGLNFIEYNAQAGKPEAFNLTATPAEVFKFMDILERDMETISGVNSVARGNPEASLKSGNALALVQSMALQYISGLQQSYVKLMEDVGSGLIQMLQDFASVPRIAIIVGKANRSYMKEFTGKDLSEINRVIVDVSNPLAHTTAGRVQMAEQMLQMNLIKTPEDYISVINTGNLDTMIDGIDHQMLLVKAENEKMVAGDTVQAIAVERHSIHIAEHRDVLADPDLKQDPNLVKRVLDHIQEHINLLRTTDPGLLTHIGETPLPPLPPPPGQGPPGPGGPPPQQAPQQGPPPPQQSAQKGHPHAQANKVHNAKPIQNILQPGTGQPGTVPQPSKPPAPFKNLPTNPQDLLPK